MRNRILITGASSGLGAEMTRQFLAMGRTVAACARRPCEAPLSYVLDVDDHDAVFATFRRARDEMGGLDRVVVNAGIGDAFPIGTGRFADNRRVAMTNFVSALAQCEAAMEIFREQNAGHLVVISSVSAYRGMRRHATTYAATKAAVSNLAEGIRSDTLRTPIRVTTIHPGYIHSEMTAGNARMPFVVDTDVGVRKIIRAMEKERGSVSVPLWPWGPVGLIMRHVPVRLLARMT